MRQVRSSATAAASLVKLMVPKRTTSATICAGMEFSCPPAGSRLVLYTDHLPGGGRRHGATSTRQPSLLHARSL